MPDLWTPNAELPHEAFVERLHKAIASFAEADGRGEAARRGRARRQVALRARSDRAGAGLRDGDALRDGRRGTTRPTRSSCRSAPCGGSSCAPRRRRGESFGFSVPPADVDEPRRDEQRHHVEPDVAARDAARRVPVRDPETRAAWTPSATSRSTSRRARAPRRRGRRRRTSPASASARGRRAAAARRRRRRRRAAAAPSGRRSPRPRRRPRRPRRPRGRGGCG